MGSHSKRSPSKWGQLRKCAGSYWAQEGMVEVYRPSSTRGVAVHAVVESCINSTTHPNQLSAHHSEWVDVKGVEGLPPEVLNGQLLVELTQEDLKAAGVMYEYIQSKFALGYVGYTELKVSPALYINRDDADGTMDVALLHSNGHLEGVDYKNGAGVVVDVRGNWQMTAYLLGLLAVMVNEGMEVTHITMTIVQPQAHHPDGPIRSESMPVSALLARVPEVVRFLGESDDPNAPRTAGVSQCQFCKVKGTCSVLAAKSLQDAQATFKALGDTSVRDINMGLEREPSALTPEQRAMVLASAQLIRGWLEAVTKYALREDLKGRKTPGFKGVRGAGGNRCYSMDDDVVGAVLAGYLDIHGQPVDATVSKLMSPAQLEQWIKPIVSASDWAEISDLVVKPAGKVTLVPDTDERTPIRQKATEVFKHLVPADTDFLS